MRGQPVPLAVLVVLAAAACAKLEDVAPGTVVTCSSTGDCPEGRACNRGRCIRPSDLGLPPDLVGGVVHVTPARGAAGTAFALSLEATRELEGPPTVLLELDPILALTCSATEGNAYSCPYTATGLENGGRGGRVSVDVRMVDRAGNETVRNGVGTPLELDFEPPALAARSAEPATVPLGGLVQVFFTTTEELRATPVVVTSRPLGAGGLTHFTPTRQPGTLNHVLAHLVTADDGPGPVVFTVDLVDAVGNSNAGLTIGAVEIDPDPPAITSLVVQPERLAATGLLTVTFDTSEPAAEGTLSVTVGGRALACGGRAAASPRFTCTRPMSGAEIPAGSEVVQTVVVSLADAAGNRAAASGSTVFDFRAPALASRAAGPGSVPLGGTLVVSFTPDEELAAPPTLTASRGLGPTRSTTFTPTRLQGSRSYQLAHVVERGEDAGAVEFTVDLTDLAGNTATAVPVGSVVIDPVAPTISAFTVSPARLSPSDTLAVTFEAEEAAPGTLVATVGGRDLACAPFSPTPPSYVCTRALLGTEIAPETEDVQPVVVSLADAAGNRTTTSGNVVLDFRPPGLAERSAEPAEVPAGGTFLVSFTPDEELRAAPRLLASRWLDEPGATRFTPARVAGTRNFQFSHAVTAADGPGLVSFEVELVDSVGNVATVPVGSVVLDLEPIALSSLVVSPDRLGASGLLTVTFGASEAAAPGTLDVTVGGRSMACAGDAAAAPTYRCTREMAPGDAPAGTESVQVVSVGLRDAAGNRTTASGSVLFDFRAPGLAGRSAEPADVGIGGVILVSLTPDEELGPAPVLIPSRPLPQGSELATFTPTRIPGTRNYQLAHLVELDDGGGPLSFQVELTDAVGNSTTAEVGTVYVDLDPIAISSVRALPERIDEVGTVLVTFDASEEAAPGTLVVTVGGRAMTCGGYAASSPRYTCSRDMVGDEIPAGTEAAQPVVITLSDRAGNRSTGSASVVFDFGGPRVAAADVAYAPPRGSALATVARAAAGARITATVLATEALAADPAPSLEVAYAGSVLPFGYLPWRSTATSAVFAALVPDGSADGDYVATIVFADLAGNVTRTSEGLPAIRVKTSTPVLGVDQDALVFVRSPWGRSTTEGLGEYTIPAGPYFAIEPSDALTSTLTLPADALRFEDGTTPTRVIVQTTSTTPVVLGVLSQDRDGRFPRQALVSPDVPGVSLVGLDDAGNPSTPVKLRDAEWVATPNRAAGTSANLLTATAIGDAARDVALAPLAVDAAAAAGEDDLAVLARSQGLWRDLSWNGGVPAGPRALAYDAARGRVVMFGTAGGSHTWEWDGRNWTEALAVSPPPRSRTAMAYDSARGRIVLFGGTGDVDDLQDTWEWDGLAWTQVATSGPQARSAHAMAYDSVRGRVVLFGGLGASGLLDDTWEWDGLAWTSTTATGPGPRWAHAMAFDAARGETLVFGGGAGTGDWGDTWAWNGTGWRPASGTGPTPRLDTAMAYDAARAEVILFGGDAYTLGDAHDTWAWNGVEWAPRPVAGPIARDGHVMAYDAARERVVLFGGITVGGASPDTWEWDGAAWSWVGTSEDPPARYWHALAYDSTRRGAILFGGQSSGGVIGDTWEWNGGRWRPVVGTGAPARAGHALAFDAARNQTILHGGWGCTYPQYTWALDGSNWVQVATTGVGKRSYHAMAYDSRRGRVLLFGGLVPDDYSGHVTQDTWSWDGRSWEQVAATGPGARQAHAMVYDAQRDRMVLFGGADPAGDPLGDTWEWDGQAWASVATGGPGARDSPAMAYDAARGRTVLFGGSGAANPADTWEWDGSSWTLAATSGPGGRWRHALAFDEARGTTVLFGGSRTTGVVGDTWTWRAHPEDRPSITFRASGASFGIPRAQIRRVEVRAHATGVAAGALPVIPGAVLLGWAVRGVRDEPGAWLERDANEGGMPWSAPYVPDAGPAALHWTSASEDEARRFFVEPDGFAFQVRPAGGAGVRPPGAAVALDDIEVRVRYTVP